MDHPFRPNPSFGASHAAHLHSVQLLFGQASEDHMPMPPHDKDRNRQNVLRQIMHHHNRKFASRGYPNRDTASAEELKNQDNIQKAAVPGPVNHHEVFS
ncbi:hypothetical protein O0I10_009391 [Lichtheimia ornata]|uniref:Uncharacterized protein n=1 Tax=Lichtheimia ornata TaxID=688661 RepID=A0AAD7XUJ0_9FUNG|nr:uncharacterized protein O0I10_009391 [Lichtheimia ornata]KAJ8654995.1 hypothetical protein O0I10_009391 [Lichtheimia ornata]